MIGIGCTFTVFEVLQVVFNVFGGYISGQQPRFFEQSRGMACVNFDGVWAVGFFAKFFCKRAHCVVRRPRCDTQGGALAWMCGFMAQ